MLGYYLEFGIGLLEFEKYKGGLFQGAIFL
jgi:hypothetical protein